MLLGNSLLKHGVSTPVSIVATSGTPQSANCGTQYTNPLMATITPALSGVSVTFTAPASGASGTFAGGTNTETVVTNAAGVATSSVFTAGPIGQEGAYNVVASVGALFCNFAMTNLVLYILRDEFTTAEGAPLASPRTCEPGPGTLALTTPANLSIANDTLIKNGASKAVSAAASTRTGLAVYERHASTAGAHSIFLSSDGSAKTHGVAFTWFTSGETGAVLDNAAVVVSPAGFMQGSIAALIILLPTGALVYLAQSNIGNFSLVYRGIAGNDASLYAAIQEDAGSLGWSKSLQALHRSGYTSIYDQAAYHNAAPVSPVSQTLTSKDVWVEMYWTPAAGETFELYVRQTDAQNRYIVRCSQAGSTIALVRVVANAETSLGSVAATWNVGTAYRVAIRADAANMHVYVDKALKINAGQTIGDTALTVGAAGFATGADFAAWPTRPAFPSPFAPTNYRWFLAFGDSKTAGGNFQATLCDDLEASTGALWNHLTLARGGFTTASMKALIDTDLTFFDASPAPEYILLATGANDVPGLPSQATFEANYGYIADAFHAKWPSAQIYCMRVWRRSYGANCDTFASWVANVVAARASFCHLGPDERIFLENGDDGATYTSDGTHPNAAGYVLTASKWQAVIGI